MELHVDHRHRASVRLKQLNRLAVPGSSRAILFADGQRLARRTFLQPSDPSDCEKCRKNSHINLVSPDPMMTISNLISRSLSVYCPCELDLTLFASRIRERAALRSDSIDSDSEELLLGVRVRTSSTTRTMTGTSSSSLLKSRLAAGFILGLTLITKPSWLSTRPIPTPCTQSWFSVSARNRFLARSTSRFLAMA